MDFFLLFFADMPIIIQVTPALCFALFFHLKDVYAKSIKTFISNIGFHKGSTISP